MEYNSDGIPYGEPLGLKWNGDRRVTSGRRVAGVFECETFKEYKEGGIEDKVVRKWAFDAKTYEDIKR